MMRPGPAIRSRAGRRCRGRSGNRFPARGCPAATGSVRPAVPFLTCRWCMTTMFPRSRRPPSPHAQLAEPNRNGESTQVSHAGTRRTGRARWRAVDLGTSRSRRPGHRPRTGLLPDGHPQAPSRRHSAGGHRPGRDHLDHGRAGIRRTTRSRTSAGSVHCGVSIMRSVPRRLSRAGPGSAPVSASSTWSTRGCSRIRSASP